MAGVASALCEQASSFSGSLVRMVNNHTVDAWDGTLCVCVCTVHVCVGTVCRCICVCTVCVYHVHACMCVHMRVCARMHVHACVGTVCTSIFLETQAPITVCLPGSGAAAGGPCPWTRLSQPVAELLLCALHIVSTSLITHILPAQRSRRDKRLRARVHAHWLQLCGAFPDKNSNHRTISWRQRGLLQDFLLN